MNFIFPKILDFNVKICQVKKNFESPENFGMEFLPDLPRCKKLFCCIPLRTGSVLIGVFEFILGASAIISFSFYCAHEKLAEKVNNIAKVGKRLLFRLNFNFKKKNFFSVFGQFSSESTYIDLCLSVTTLSIGILLIVAALKQSKDLVNVYVFAKSLLCVAIMMGTFFNFANVPLKGFIFFFAFVINIYFLLCVISYMHELPEKKVVPPPQENIELK